MTSSNIEQVSIREHVGAYCGSTGKSRRQVAADMGIPYSTFLTKLNGPSEFSYSEGIALARLIGVSPDEMAKPILNANMA